MTRTLKLSVALAAILALGAVGASASRAESSLDVGNTFTHWAWLTGTQSTQNKLIIATGGGNVTLKCNTATVQGTTLDGNNTELTLAPKYSACTLAGLVATVHTNGCEYTLTPRFVLSFTLDIVCTALTPIEITSVGCTITITSQNNLQEILVHTYAPVGAPHHVEPTLQVKKIAVVGAAGCPPNLVGAHTAEMTGSITLKAYADNFGAEGVQVNLTAT